MGYFGSLDQVLKLFWSLLIYCNNFYFFMFSSILTFDFDLILWLIWLFVALMGHLLDRNFSKNYLGVKSKSWKTFIFFASSNDSFCFLFKSWFFLGPKCDIMWVKVRLTKCFGVYSCSWKTILSMFPSIPTYDLTQF